MTCTCDPFCEVHRRSSDSSYSRTYLTKRNYHGPQLLKAIRNRTQSLRSPQDQSAQMVRMLHQPVDDVMHEPESSSDDDVKSAEVVDKGDLSSSTKSLPFKRKREAVEPVRSSKRKKLEDKQDLGPLLSKSQDRPPASQQTEFELLSQLSQSRKRQGYGNRHRSRYTPGMPIREIHDERKPAFNSQDIDPRQSTPPKVGRKFHNDKDFTAQDEGRHGQLPSITAMTEEPEPALSTSTSATRLRLLDETPEPEDPDTKPAALSTPPTSPEVTDVDELVEKGPRSEPEAPTVTCPVCHEEVDCAELSKSDKMPNLLSLKKQQDFCHQHRLVEARASWQKRNYPSLDWQVLELVRIPKHLPRLRRVLNRKVKSYYLDQLDMSVTKARGNRKAVRSYMQESILDLAQAGYYGPKGIQVMMNAVTSELSKDLNMRLDDKLVRAAGVGNYVAAVLVPELTLRLVMEDLGIKDEAEARRTLDESTEIGLLMNPDDDHVEQDELD